MNDYIKYNQINSETRESLKKKSKIFKKTLNTTENACSANIYG